MKDWARHGRCGEPAAAPARGPASWARGARAGVLDTGRAGRRPGYGARGMPATARVDGLPGHQRFRVGEGAVHSWALITPPALSTMATPLASSPASCPLVFIVAATPSWPMICAR